MKLSEFIERLQAVEAEHGPDVEVLAMAFGDYLDSDPTLFVEERHRYAHASGWKLREPFDEEEPPLESAMVVYVN